MCVYVLGSVQRVRVWRARAPLYFTSLNRLSVCFAAAAAATTRTAVVAVYGGGCTHDVGNYIPANADIMPRDSAGLSDASALVHRNTQV